MEKSWVEVLLSIVHHQEEPLPPLANFNREAIVPVTFGAGTPHLMATDINPINNQKEPMIHAGIPKSITNVWDMLHEYGHLNDPDLRMRGMFYTATSNELEEEIRAWKFALRFVCKCQLKDFLRHAMPLIDSYWCKVTGKRKTLIEIQQELIDHFNSLNGGNNGEIIKL